MAAAEQRTARYAGDVMEGTPTSPDGSGWVMFASMMLVLAGAFNVIDGIVALSKSSFYVAGAHYVFSDLTTWGWIVLIIGAAQVLAGFYVWRGSQLARWFGIGTASLNAIAQLMFIQAYPWWSLALFALDLLVIYGLAVYGGQDYTLES
jgi:hypothetical protein